MDSNTSFQPGLVDRMPAGLAKPFAAATPGRALAWRASLVLWVLCGLAPVEMPAQSTEPANAGLTNGWVSQPVSLADAVNIALTRNRTVQKARKNIEAAEGVALQMRAIAIPKVQATGNYNAVQPSSVEQPEFNLPGFTNSAPFTFGTDQSWRAQVRVVQSLYEGGRMLSSFRAARLARKQAWLNYQTTIANVILDVQTAFYDVLLAEQQIRVQEASVELLTRELADTQRRFEAGTVPRFNVLRAEVELANARPRLSRARNSFRTSKNVLANAMGLDVPREALEDIPLPLAGSLKPETLDLSVGRALAMGLEKRTELQALRTAEALRRQDLVNARAGYKPSLQAFAGYDVHSSMFDRDLTEELHGWIAGVQASWDIFDGFRTRGRVVEARSLLGQAALDLDDTARRIELEIRIAFSAFVEAREVMESQEKVLEQADEALRLARARYEAGTGTQLDVLSAQTALTDARTTQIQSMRDYAVARARLERNTGLNLELAAPQPANGPNPP